MNLPQLLLLNFLLAAYLTGVIWTVQLVHYPGFAQANRETFILFHREHSRRISWVVMGPMVLELLLALSRLGSMRAVAEEHHLTTSTVSAQIAALARETGAQLIEPEGRRVRLTPAGRRLADHAVTILAAVERARVDLDADRTLAVYADGEPAGTLPATFEVRRAAITVLAADPAPGFPPGL